jgi:hypothetical protein
LYLKVRGRRSFVKKEKKRRRKERGRKREVCDLYA